MTLRKRFGRVNWDPREPRAPASLRKDSHKTKHPIVEMAKQPTDDEISARLRKIHG
jgi:hypothetical protein